MTKQDDAIELDQDLKRQQREWQIERFSWGLWAVVMLAAFIGLLGPGPVSKSTSDSPDGSLHVAYQRFVRHRSPSEFIIEVAPEEAHEGTLVLYLDQEFVQKTQIELISPRPSQERLEKGHIFYAFQVGEDSTPLQIIYQFELDSFGPLSTPVGIVDGPEVSIRQFVYP